MAKKHAVHAANGKGTKFGAGAIAGAAGVAAMLSVIAPANAATVQVKQVENEMGTELAHLSRLNSAEGVLDAIGNQLNLSKDLKGNLNQAKLEDVTISLQGITSKLQLWFKGSADTSSSLDQIASQLKDIRGEQTVGLSQNAQGEMRTSLQKILSNLQGIVEGAISKNQAELQS